MRIIATVGLPASGKSTWAQQWCAENEGWIRVCDGDISRARFGINWSPETSRAVKLARFQAIRDAATQGLNVIIENCNLSDESRREAILIARELEATLEWRSFTHVRPYVCVQRDALRGRAGGVSVGSAVIHSMAQTYGLEPKRKARA